MECDLQSHTNCRYCSDVFTHVNEPKGSSRIWGWAVGVCRLDLNYPGIIWSTEPTFMVQPVKGCAPFLITVITKYFLDAIIKVAVVIKA